MRELRSLLRYRMADKKINSVKELMEISDLSRNAINPLYNEEKLEGTSLGTLKKLCDALDCDLHDLIEYKR